MDLGIQKKVFLQQFDAILENFRKTEVNLSLDKGGDQADQVIELINHNLESRLGDRNIRFLKKVAAAKQKILNDTFGECEDCGEQIDEKRLKARPTAELCIHCQENKEGEEFHLIHFRKDLDSKKITDESDGYIGEREKVSNISSLKFESVVDF